MFCIFKLADVRNRAYVIDTRGNKLFYGTVYQCNKFIEYMNNEGGSENGKSICKISKRENCGKMDN